MAEPQIAVVLRLREAWRAEMQSFRTSFQRLGPQIQSSLSSAVAGFASLGGIALGLRAAFRAVDDLEKSKRTLASTAQFTGANLSALQQIAAGLGQQFRLDDDTANRLTETVTRLTAVSGQLGRTEAATAAFLELGAAKGMAAEETMQALEGATVGQFRAAQQLLGQNIPELFERHAAAVGKTVSELSEQEKAQIIVNQALANAGRVGGAYNAFLDSAAGRQERLRISLNNLGETVGAALEPARRAVMNLIDWLIARGRDFIGGIQILYAEAGGVFFSIPSLVRIAAARALEVFAEFVDAASLLLQRLGIDVGEGLSRTLHQASFRMLRQGTQNLAMIRAGVRDTVAEIVGIEQAIGRVSGGVGRSSLGGAAASRRLTEAEQRRLRELQRGHVSAAELQRAFRRGEAGPAIVAPRATDIDVETAAERRRVREGGVRPLHTLQLEEGGEADQQVDGFIERMMARIEEMRGPIQDLRDQLVDLTGTVLEGLATGFENAFLRASQGAKAMGRAFFDAMRQSVAGAAQTRGRYFLAEALGAFGTGLLGDPKGFLAAAKFAAAAAAMFTVAGAVGSGGGGGGGGGASPVAFEQRQTRIDAAGRPQVIMELHIDGFDPDNSRHLERLRRGVERGTELRLFVNGQPRNA